MIITLVCQRQVRKEEDYKIVWCASVSVVGGGGVEFRAIFISLGCSPATLACTYLRCLIKCVFPATQNYFTSQNIVWGVQCVYKPLSGFLPTVLEVNMGGEAPYDYERDCTSRSGVLHTIHTHTHTPTTRCDGGCSEKGNWEGLYRKCGRIHPCALH